MGRQALAASIALVAVLAVASSVGARHAGQSASGRIAFTSEKDGNKDIYVVNADGSGLERLTSEKGDDEFPAWSRDGRRIAFVSYRNFVTDIYVMNADGSNVRQVTRGPGRESSPAWSADGKRLVYASTGSGDDGNELY